MEVANVSSGSVARAVVGQVAVWSSRRSKILSGSPQITVTDDLKVFSDSKEDDFFVPDLEGDDGLADLNAGHLVDVVVAALDVVHIDVVVTRGDFVKVTVWDPGIGNA